MLPNSQRNHFVLCIISSLGYKFNVKDGKSNGMSEGEAEEEGGGLICGGWQWRLAVGSSSLAPILLFSHTP